MFTSPFVMAPVNTRVVRRSRMLLDDNCGTKMHYRECMGFSGVTGPIAATVAVVAQFLFGIALFIPGIGAIVEQVAPPGSGPGEWLRSNGKWKFCAVALSSDGKHKVWAEVSAKTQDPGYLSTSKIVSETAMALLDEVDGVPCSGRWQSPTVPGGVCTPASACGLRLCNRLESHGIKFRTSKSSVEECDNRTMVAHALLVVLLHTVSLLHLFEMFSIVRSTVFAATTTDAPLVSFLLSLASLCVAPVFCAAVLGFLRVPMRSRNLWSVLLSILGIFWVCDGPTVRWTAKGTDIVDLNGKVAVVTGANSGFGFEICRELAGRGAIVHMVCRDALKCAAASETLVKKHGIDATNLVQHSVDLSDLNSVYSWPGVFGVHTIALNAGFISSPRDEGLRTAQSLEPGFGTMHIGHVALMGRLTFEKRGTVVVVASEIHHLASPIQASILELEHLISNETLEDKRGDVCHSGISIGGWPSILDDSMVPFGAGRFGCSYPRAKLSNVLWGAHLAKKRDDLKVVIASPAFANTNIYEGSNFRGVLQLYLNYVCKPFLMRSAKVGATPIFRALLDEAVASGSIVDSMGAVWKIEYACFRNGGCNARSAENLWDVTERILTALQPKLHRE